MKIQLNELFQSIGCSWIERGKPISSFDWSDTIKTISLGKANQMKRLYLSKIFSSGSF
jgi:hypothetical protein